MEYDKDFKIQASLHDLRNKVTILQGCYYKVVGGDDIQETNFLRTIDRMNHIISDIYLETRPDKKNTSNQIPTTSIIDLSTTDFIDKLSDMISDISDFYGLNLTLKYPIMSKYPYEKISFNKKLLHQSIENILENCHKSQAKNILVNLSRTHLQDKVHLLVSIADDGKGYKSINKDESIPHGLGTKIIHKNMEILNGTYSTLIMKNRFINNLHFLIK